MTWPWKYIVDEKFYQAGLIPLAVSQPPAVGEEIPFHAWPHMLQ